ncbi:sugar ABC transporter substrate-binding protein [Clostridium saccharobutylicum]|uniref:Putative rhizopine-binding protein MocB n=1 Tax=Clostridium saccharobutylicum DSM 13864 TaxID=1345695 RepID=U5MTM2_CLOSA|nr:sugar ABC transporter substrate-binding protein [Clostridium saccharobutylicum]AGX42807.1 putative rhizopine-binding protein MocB [Clostridium saccharobutylicum DSM 13864]AQR90104.1 D-galactose-binding periplasmic protein precursor [Clostridium saccharobutylicum]AQS00010.1 D-galactose-binding periplasmic protein precursor [Clostridium saccharobutylicum]AQS09795.1 D-galactose-binding periplasmic protein precursor [Clostridium saccharobutylicum]AQS13993.1 D-galactose-binding periplasmic prote
MKKKIVILLTIIMMFAAISGCASKSGTASSKNVKILFSMSNSADSYRGMLVKSAEDYAKGKNVELKVMDAAGSIEEQVSHMKEAASGGYSAIICAPVNPDTTLQLKKAAKGIPIIFMNSKPSEELLEKDKYIYVASDESLSGKYQAEYITDYLKNKNDLKVVLFKGESNNSATKERTKSVKDAFKEKGINANYVFEDYADWSRQGTKDMFNVFLSTNRKFDCVICNNDEMALGVIDALKENKIDPSTVPIVGIDATAEGCKAISEGSMKFTVFQSAQGQSKSAVDAAIQLGSGGTLSNVENVTQDGKHIWVPFEKVDKNNVSKYS